MAGQFDITDQQQGDWWAQNDPNVAMAVPYQGQLTAPLLGQPLANVGQPSLAGDTQTTQLPAVDPVRQFVLDGFAAKGKTPRDEADIQYWIDKINSTGGLGDAGNASYWSGRLRQDQGGAGDYQERPESGSSSSSTLGAMGQAPTATTFQAPAAPAYTPYTPGPAPTPTPFVAPTLEQARNAPGFQSAMESADQGIQRSALAHSGLSGGLLKDLSQYNIGLADQNYGNVFNQALSGNQANNGQALNAYTAGANANIGAGNLNLSGTNQQFQNTYQPAWNAYQSNVGQQQFGANFGLQANQQAFGQGLQRDQFNLGAQGQYWNQGLAQNQNAYNQYDNSQKTAFDQWYKTAQLGNPGNPYT